MGMLSKCKNTKNKTMTYLIGGGLHHTLFNSLCGVPHKGYLISRALHGPLLNREE